ncbi:SlyX family protein [Martelella lutilitoris]|uniref:Protein SlyX homolog n=1 Tax=Martelella lutilitoris TaxID=2583532 RepID=A0A7T7HKD9_9HYPH|nr:SlyX family protein [Martelella lutilitoris]QQM30811.1 SlyX family protein [Martelella lutilitoris]
MTEERIVRLEETVAYQTKTIDELSDQVAQQWKMIEGLEKKFELLTDRFLELEESAGERPAVTKPPHY